MIGAFLSFDGAVEGLSRAECPRLDKFKWGYIYAVALSNGWIKVGRTADPTERLKAIQRGLRSTGITLGRTVVTHAHVNFDENEKALLLAFEHKSRDGEFFVASISEAIAAISALRLQLRFTDEELAHQRSSEAGAYSIFNTVFGSRPEGLVK